MSPKTRKTIGWVLTGLSAAFLLFSAAGKFMLQPEAVEAIRKTGQDPAGVWKLGLLEVVCTLLFVLPRTGMLGTLLLAAYLGGAIATHIALPQAGPPIAPVILQIVVWIAAALRFPELTARLTGRPLV